MNFNEVFFREAAISLFNRDVTRFWIVFNVFNGQLASVIKYYSQLLEPPTDEVNDLLVVNELINLQNISFRSYEIRYFVIAYSVHKAFGLNFYF